MAASSSLLLVVCSLTSFVLLFIYISSDRRELTCMAASPPLVVCSLASFVLLYLATGQNLLAPLALPQLSIIRDTREAHKSFTLKVAAKKVCKKRQRRARKLAVFKYATLLASYFAVLPSPRRRAQLGAWYIKKRTKYHWEDIVPDWEEADFRYDFRLSRQHFQLLLDSIQEQITGKRFHLLSCN